MLHIHLINNFICDTIIMKALVSDVYLHPKKGTRFEEMKKRKYTICILRLLSLILLLLIILIIVTKKMTLY